MSFLVKGSERLEGKEDRGIVVLKFEDGEDLFGCINKAIEDFDIKSGFIILGIGMLTDIEIGFFTKGGYEWKHLEEPHELIALHGSISTKGETVIHLHCGLANKNHDIIGGHLRKAKVFVINEILIKKLINVELGRNLNPVTGLKELYICE
jgi:predicted DNA-binding protein with PD1-like motif